MTLSWPDVDSLGLLPSALMFCLNLKKVPPPILTIKIPCKNDLRRDFDDCSLPSHWGFFNKESYDRIRSLLVFSSEFLHFRRTQFSTRSKPLFRESSLRVDTHMCLKPHLTPSFTSSYISSLYSPLDRVIEKHMSEFRH